MTRNDPNFSEGLLQDSQAQAVKNCKITQIDFGVMVMIMVMVAVFIWDMKYIIGWKVGSSP